VPRHEHPGASTIRILELRRGDHLAGVDKAYFEAEQPLNVDEEQQVPAVDRKRPDKGPALARVLNLLLGPERSDYFHNRVSLCVGDRHLSRILSRRENVAAVQRIDRVV
jgi:hypothetical protein